MPRSVSIGSRSAADWAIRAAGAGILAWLAYGDVTRSTAYAIRGSDVEQAYRLSPDDGRIAALLSESRLTIRSDRAGQADAGRLARRALQNDPTAVAAVATLGINAELGGDTPLARRHFAYAEKLSRRHLRTQLWGIEDAVARGDIAAALTHYDIALRTSRVASDLLFPVLSAALDEFAVRNRLARTLASKPPWGTAFVEYAAANAPKPLAVAMLTHDMRKVGAPVSDTSRALIVNKLLAANLTDQAWRYYASFRVGAQRRWSRDPRFSTPLANPTAFDWTPVEGEGTTTSITHDAAGGFFDFAVSPGGGGPMLRQMQMLPPGRYAMTAIGAGFDASTGDGPYWLLACANGQQIGRVEAERSGSAAGWIRRPTDGAERMPGSISVACCKAARDDIWHLRANQAHRTASGRWIDCVPMAGVSLI